MLAAAVLASLAAIGGGVALLATISGPALAQTGGDDPGEVDLDTFYRELSPYGDWLEHPRYGTVWRPHVEDGWRPYTRGHWAFTDEHGWYWVAEEPWGWAPFHYGRWAYDERNDEWLWVPGTEWAPAWVMWRESEDHIGWAPLPPDATWDGDRGLSYSASFYEGPRFSSYWVFLSPRYMFEPGLWRHFVPRARHATIWRETRVVRDHHRFTGGRIFHAGIDRARIERWAGRSVPVVTLRPVSSPRSGGWRNIGDPRVVPVYRPRFVATTPDRTPRIFGQQPNIGGNRSGGPQPGNGGFWGRRFEGQRDPFSGPGNRSGGDPSRGPDFRRQDDQRVQQERQRQQDQARQQQEQDRRRQDEQRAQQERQRQQDQARQQAEQDRRRQEEQRAQQERQRQQDQARQQQEQDRRRQDEQRQRDLQRIQEQQRQQDQRRQDMVRQQEELRRREQQAQQELQRQRQQQQQGQGQGRGPGQGQAQGQGQGPGQGAQPGGGRQGGGERRPVCQPGQQPGPNCRAP
jgi:hypothetical protein